MRAKIRKRWWIVGVAAAVIAAAVAGTTTVLLRGGGQDGTPLSADGVALGATSTPLLGKGTSLYEQYVSTMTRLKEQGDTYTTNGMELQADYCYGAAGAGISSLRLAIDHLLGLKEQKTAVAEIAGDRYSDWDAIAAVSYVSPYPYYFEGLVANIAGDRETAATCYKNALMNPAFPAEGISFDSLNDLDTATLRQMEQALTAIEDAIYAVYQPKPTSGPRDPLNFSDEYLRARAAEALRADPVDYGGALAYYRLALAVNPFESKNFASLAVASIYLGDMNGALHYTNEGLWVDPDDGPLNRIASLLNGDTGGAR